MAGKTGHEVLIGDGPPIGVTNSVARTASISTKLPISVAHPRRRGRTSTGKRVPPPVTEEPRSTADEENKNLDSTVVANPLTEGGVAYAVKPQESGDDKEKRGLDPRLGTDPEDEEWDAAPLPYAKVLGSQAKETSWADMMEADDDDKRAAFCALFGNKTLESSALEGSWTPTDTISVPEGFLTIFPRWGKLMKGAADVVGKRLSESEVHRIDETLVVDIDLFSEDEDRVREVFRSLTLAKSPRRKSFLIWNDIMNFFARIPAIDSKGYTCTQGDAYVLDKMVRDVFFDHEKREPVNAKAWAEASISNLANRQEIVRHLSSFLGAGGVEIVDHLIGGIDALISLYVRKVIKDNEVKMRELALIAARKLRVPDTKLIYNNLRQVTKVVKIETANPRNPKKRISEERTVTSLLGPQVHKDDKILTGPECEFVDHLNRVVKRAAKTLSDAADEVGWEPVRLDGVSHLWKVGMGSLFQLTDDVNRAIKARSRSVRTEALKGRNNPETQKITGAEWAQAKDLIRAREGGGDQNLFSAKTKIGRKLLELSPAQAITGTPSMLAVEEAIKSHVANELCDAVEIYPDPAWV
jgi:hypothetical protein